MSPQQQKTRLDETTTRSPRLGLSLTQVVGSAIAATAAAFGASYLGVAGTIIGAAVASVIATVASAMYTTSVTRTREVVRTTVTQWTGTTSVGPVVDPGAPSVAASAATAEPATRRPPWTRVALAAAAVLGVVLGGVTVVEAFAGKPLATVVGGSTARGTTLGSVDGSGGSTPHPHRVETPAAPTADPTPTAGATSTPTPTSTPSSSPAPPPVDPSASASQDPTPTPGSTPPGPAGG